MTRVRLIVTVDIDDDLDVQEVIDSIPDALDAEDVDVVDVELDEDRPMTPEELAVSLADHARWLQRDGGARAYLGGADLRDANLHGADLRDAGLAWACEWPVGQGRRTLTAWWDGERVMIRGGCWRGTIDETLAVIEGEPWNWSDGSPEDRQRWRAEVGDAARRLHARVLAQVEANR